MTSSRLMVMGTRASALARRQTELALQVLQRAQPRRQFQVKEVITQGDRQRERPFQQLGVGVFVKELETALLKGNIDIAVHSFKDLPTSPTPGLTIAAIPEREDVRDVLVSRLALPLAELPRGARIGTGSPRRAAQLKALRPDLQVVALRGNVDTRLKKAMSEEYDGVVLAAAGLHRLGVTGYFMEYLPLDDFLPAAGQGALALEVRAKDQEALELCQAADHAPTRAAVMAERAFLEGLGGGCRVPIATLGEIFGGSLRLRGVLMTPDGKGVVRAEVEGKASRPEEAGQELARKILGMGDQAILREEVRP
jgi:hydroxymethylbilane synthase